MPGKCPHCKTALAKVHIEKIEAIAPDHTGKDAWDASLHSAFTYSCPSCHTVLSVGIDSSGSLVSIATQVARLATNLEKK